MPTIDDIVQNHINSNARGAFASGYLDKATPDSTAQDIANARELGVSVSEAKLMTPAAKAQAQADKLMRENWIASAPVYKSRVITDPTLFKLTKDDPVNTGILESLWWRLAGEPGKPTGYGSAAVNSMARGGYGLANAVNMSQWDDVQSQRELYKSYDDGIAAGKTNVEIFGDSEVLPADMRRALYEQYRDRMYAELERQEKALSGDVAHTNYVSSLFPQSDSMREVSKADSFGQALSAFASSPLLNLANIGPESAVMFAPAAPAIAAASLAGPAAAGAVAGAYSRWVDEKASLAGMASEEAKDATRGDMILGVLKDASKMEGFRDKAVKHSIPVGLLDGLSAGLAGKVLLPSKVLGKLTPSGKRWADFATQIPFQGALGGSGEALGQIAAEGAVTSWGDVVAEIAGEGFGAPLEMASIRAKNWMDAKQESLLSQQKTELLRQSVQAIKDNKLLERSPEIAAGFLQKVGEASGVSEVTFDAAALHQDGSDALLVQAIPSLAEPMEQAVQRGGEVRVRLEELTQAVKADPAVGDVTIKHGNIKDSKSSVQAQEALEQAQADLGEEIGKQIARSDPEVAEQLKEIKNQIVEAMKGVTTVKEAQTGTTLFTTLAANMASDLGIKPREFWDKYGIKAFLGKDDVRIDADGKGFAVSERAKTLVFNKQEALSQSGLTPEQKTLADRIIAEAPNKAANLKEAVTLAKSKGAKLTNVNDGRVATITRNNLDKMKSAKAVNKSVSPSAHVHALANLAELYERSVRLWSRGDNKPPEGDKTSLSKVHRYVALMPFEENVFPVKLTVKEYTEEGKGSAIYTIEAVEVDESTSLREWVQAERIRDNAVSDSEIDTLTDNLSQIFDSVRPRGGKYSQGSLGEYIPKIKAIILWENANPSTVLHETGHWYLDTYFAVASTIDRNKEPTEGEKHVLANTEGVLKWFGLESLEQWNSMSLEEKRPYHEKFARTFEAYLYEGNAPTKALSNVFRKFKQWLRKVYVTVAGIAGADINPETRELFDRMLIASSAVEEAKARRQIVDLTEQMKANGSDMQVLLETAEIMRERDESAQEWLLSKLLKDAVILGRLRSKKFKVLQEEAKKLESSLFDEEREKMKEDPKVKLWNLLTSGKEQEDGKLFKPKLSVKDLEDGGLTAEQIQALKDKDMVYNSEDETQTEMNWDSLADEYGFSSVSEMAQYLAEAPEPTDFVLARAKARMAQEFSEFADEKALQRQADRAVMNEAQERVLSNMIRALEKTQKVGFDKDVFTTVARAELSAMSLKDIKPQRFRNQAEARSRDVRKAIKNNDLKAAVLALRQQLYQTICAREAQRIQDNRESFLKLAGKIRGRKELKGTAVRYLIMAQSLISQAGVTVRGDYLKDAVTLNEFVKQCADNDEAIPAIDLMLESRIASVNRDFASLSGEVFEELDNAVRDLLNLGRKAEQIRIGNEMEELAETVAKCRSVIETTAQEHGREADGDMEKSGAWGQFKNLMNQVGLSHARIQSVFKVMEGGKAGPLFDYIIAPTDKAAAVETRLKREYTQKMQAAFKPLYVKGFLGREKPIYHSSVGISVTRSQVIAMALNMGNSGNRDRLIRGSHLWKEITGGKKLTEEDVLTLISETLTKQELESVQKVWDLFEELRPQLQEQQKRLTGRSPKWVEAEAIQFKTKDGETVQLKGGYYPIMYDSRASDKGARLKALDNAMSGAANVKMGEHTYGGFLETRAKKVEGLALSLTATAGFNGLDHAIHRIAWEETSVNTWKLIKELSPMIRDYYGADMARAIETWMRANAAGELTQTTTIDGFARFIRQNVSMAGLGFNLVTALIQPLGIINSVPVIGNRWVLKGVSEFLSMTPKGAADFVFARSETMADRATTQFRELQEVSALATGTTGEAKNAVMRLAYKPIVVMQMAVDIPTWLGAYNKALSEGNTEQRACALADRAVIDAQGSGRASDLSAIERGNAWTQLLTTFYTFFNAVLNNLVVSAKTKGKLQFACDLLLVIAVQSVIETMVREGLKSAVKGDSGEDWWEHVLDKAPAATAGFSLGLFVFLREASSLGDNYSGPAGLRKLQDVNRLIQQIGQGELDEALLKSAVSVVGSFFGLPAAPINRAISGTSALREGKTDSWLAPLLGYSEH